jgi:CRP-like cAMP-binding protein
VPYFASLPAGELRQLAARCTVRSVDAGEALFEEGEPCHGLLIVADGRVEVRPDPARRARHFASIVSDLAFRPVTERLARYLDTIVEEPIKPGVAIELTITQAQLAARLGTVRELVARAFAQLEGSGVISRDRSRVTIRDPARLRALARGDEEAPRGEGHVT